MKVGENVVATVVEECARDGERSSIISKMMHIGQNITSHQVFELRMWYSGSLIRSI